GSCRRSVGPVAGCWRAGLTIQWRRTWRGRLRGRFWRARRGPVAVRASAPAAAAASPAPLAAATRLETRLAVPRVPVVRTGLRGINRLSGLSGLGGIGVPSVLCTIVCGTVGARRIGCAVGWVAAGPCRPGRHLADEFLAQTLERYDTRFSGHGAEGNGFAEDVHRQNLFLSSDGADQLAFLGESAALL